MPDPLVLVQTAINGLYAASYLSLVAVGLVLIFGVMRIINFAHGELYMAGAYAVYWVYAVLGQPYIVALLAGLAVAALIGALMERLLFRPMRDNPLGGLIMSIGVLLILQAGAVELFGVRAKHIPAPFKGGLQVLGVEGLTISGQRLLVIVVSALVLAALWLFLRRSRLGWALRACAQDPEAAALQGIAINRIAMLAMVVGAGLAGIAGALTATVVPTNPYMGHSVIIAAFIVIIVGGIGSLEGALLAAVLYAFVHTFVTTLFDGVIADVVGLVLMFVVLTIKPVGLFGTSERA